MKNRIVPIAIFSGVVIVAVTFIGAARLSGDDKQESANTRVISPVKNGSRGVVVFGKVDIDHGAGLIPIFPENLPQPSVVTRVLVREGDRVTAEPGKETVLVEFDSELAGLKVLEARAGLAKATEVLRGAEAILTQSKQNHAMHELAVQAQQLALRSKEAELEAARIEWQDKYNKAKRIEATNDPDLRAAEKKLDAAQQNLDGEKKKLEALKIGNLLNPFSIPEPRAQAGVNEAKRAVEIQEAQLKQAEYGMRMMKLRSRVNGRIVRSMVAEGMTFGMQTRQPAFLIQPDGNMIVRAEVDQEWASRIALRQEAVITDDGSPNLKWTGRVIRIGDCFLPARSNFSPEGLQLNDARVLECIISIEAGTTTAPVRVGQRVKVSIGVE